MRVATESEAQVRADADILYGEAQVIARRLRALADRIGGTSGDRFLDMADEVCEWAEAVPVPVVSIERSIPAPIIAGPIVVDTHNREAKVNDHVLDLSRMEFDLLAYLARDPRRVFSKQDILHDVWGYKKPGKTRTIDSHASRLRIKLRAAGVDNAVTNVWGLGYALYRTSVADLAAA